MKKPREEIVTGNWQIDETGRRYRMVGNCKEYATVITTTHGDVYADELKEHQKRWQEEEMKQRQKPEKPKHIDKLCPFKNFHRDMIVNCVSDCAFYKDGCSLANADPRQTKDKICPFMRKCSDRCAFYKDGCTMNLAR